MMVTVRERTTEIGIRRAIGARPKDILQQILSESMVLTTIAGMMGISFAVLVLQVMDMTITSDSGRIFRLPGYIWFGCGHLCLINHIGHAGRTGPRLPGNGH